MKEKIKQIENEILGFDIHNVETLEKFRIHFLGSKNCIKDLFSELKNVPNEDKKEVGQLMNALRNGAQEKFDVSKI